MSTKRRIGLVGYGHVGEFLASNILESEDLELEFIWNRTMSRIPDSLSSYVLRNLEDVSDRCCDIIVEVSHPDITTQFGAKFLKAADYMIGSPTALCDQQLQDKLLEASRSSDHGIYVPSGALWGGDDIRKMSNSGNLKGLTVTMKKHPGSLKLQSPLLEKLDTATAKETVLYEGPVRDLCPLAPNNVNTMATAAIAASNLGFDKTIGRLIADPSLTNHHIVEIDVEGPGGFTVKTVRRNPAQSGSVTGQQTYRAILESLKRAHGKGVGMHLC